MNYIIYSKKILSGIILSFALLFSLFIISSAKLNPFDVQFPISELGNCGSMTECKTYCDNPANAKACTDWAVAKGFIQSPPPQQRSPELPAAGGPGGCKSREECDIYCSQPEHGEECFRFAKEHNLIPQKEIQQIEKEMVHKEGPGGCRSRQECDAFCRNPDNTETCINFAVKEGKITQEEASFMIERTKMYPPPGGPGRPPEQPGLPMPPRGPRPPEPPQIDMEKAKKLLETIGGPAGCKTMDECDAFCSMPENNETCLKYAVDNGLIPENQIHKIKKIMESPGPGGCRGPGECDTYCSRPEHGEECFNFAKENGLMPPEEIQRMEKERQIIKKLEQQGGGPGGCRSAEECHTYCSDPSHFDECAAFSVKEGMMTSEKAKEMLREFVDIDERKFERFGPPGFGPRFIEGFGPPPTEEEFGPQGPPPGFEEKFQERFKMFEQHQQEFKQREEFCSNPENADKCRQFGPGPMIPPQPGMMPERMAPPEGIIPPSSGKFEGREFPGQGEPFKEGQRPPGMPWNESQGPPPPMMWPAPSERGMPPIRPVIPLTPEQETQMRERLRQMQVPPVEEGIMPPTNMITPPPTEQQTPPPPPSPEQTPTGANLFQIFLKPFKNLLRL